MSREVLYVDLPSAEFRRDVKRAALERNTTVRAIVVELLERWLKETSREGAEAAEAAATTPNA